jgi:hypothetical protein
MPIRILRKVLFVAFCLLTNAHGLSGQVLNMSHDLVPLGIAGQNLTPNSPSLDARPLFQAALQYIQTHSVQTLTLDKGAYYLLTLQQGNAALVVHANNLIIDLAGSTLYFNGPLLPTGLLLYYASNVTLKNFQTDYLNPPYTHVQLTSVDSANRLLHYQALPNWPDPSSFNNVIDPYGIGIETWIAIFRGGQIVPGTARSLVSLPITNATLRLIQDGTPWTQSATLSTLQPGDTVVVTARAAGAILQAWRSDAITLSNIKIYGSNDWAIDFFETSNSLIDHVSVMPRPGVGLVASNADGIHFDSVYQNNHVRNCYVTRTMDDAIAMTSPFKAKIVNISGSRQMTVSRVGFNRFSNAAVNFVDPVSTLEITGPTVVSQTPPDSNAPGFGEQIVLTFDADLPSLQPGYGMVAASPPVRGQASTIEDNLVEDVIAGHGIWINGVVGLTVQR